MRTLVFLLVGTLTSSCAFAATKAHVVSFGRWQQVKYYAADEMQGGELGVRALYVDGKLKEYTSSQPHDVTERVFVVARAVRLNDALPNENRPRWIWQWGGWLQVDRSSGHIIPVHLPDFDANARLTAWYRDYAAYCGLASDGRFYAIIMQLGSRKPVLRKALEHSAGADDSASLCSALTWERDPARVEFALSDNSKVSFTLRTRVLETAAAEEDEASD
jgi:hypothetical protein